ncbi:unnamed protein product [Calypogeia fissa]
MDPARALEGAYEAEKMLDVYIYDFLKKRKFEESAKAFLQESKLPTENAIVAIDAPDGFLLEWWTVFWDVFKVQSGQPHSAIAASYVKTQQMKSKEEQRQLQQRLMMMQAGRPNTGLSTSNYVNFNKVGPNSPRMSLDLRSASGDMQRLRQSAMFSAEMLASQNKSLVPQSDTTERVQTHSGNVDDIGESSTNPAQVSNSTFVPSKVGDQQQQMANLLSSPGLMPQGGDHASQMRPQMQMNGAQGWPVSASGLRRPTMTSQGGEQFGQASGQMPLRQRALTTQMQQQMYLRLQNQQAAANQNQRMLVGSGLNSPPIDGIPGNAGNDVEFSEGAVSSPSVSQGSQDNRDMSLLMLQAQQQQQLQQKQSNLLMRQQLQRQQQQLSQPDRLSAVGGTSKIIIRKRKEKSDSSQDPGANSFGGGTSITEYFSPSPTSDPTHPLTTVSTAQQQVMQTQMAHPIGSPTMSQQRVNSSGEVKDGNINPADHAVELQVDSSLPMIHEDVSMTSNSLAGDTELPSDSIPAEVDASPKFIFREVGCLRASTSKVLCCHFSSDGRLLASAGHDKKVNLWNMSTLQLEHTLEEHVLTITDVRFSPTSTHLATSSFDKTVRVWEVANLTNSIRTLIGHATSVWALDFHPNTEDLLCSCDGEGEIRYWSVSEGTCVKSFKGGVTQLRFQPVAGRFLAASAANVVTIFDVESESSVYCLLNHTKPVNNLCWSASGDFLVSLTEDYVRVWSVGSSNLEGGERSKCMHELSCKEKVFQSCVFHPTYPSLLVIGCYQSMELWNMVEDKIMTLKAHDGLVVSLVACPISSLVASASHDKCVKLWQ